MRSVKPMGRTRGSAPHRVATRAHVVVASASTSTAPAPASSAARVAPSRSPTVHPPPDTTTTCSPVPRPSAARASSREGGERSSREENPVTATTSAAAPAIDRTLRGRLGMDDEVKVCARMDPEAQRGEVGDGGDDGNRQPAQAPQPPEHLGDAGVRRHDHGGVLGGDQPPQPAAPEDGEQPARQDARRAPAQAEPVLEVREDQAERRVEGRPVLVAALTGQPIAASPSRTTTSVSGATSAIPAASSRAGPSCPSPIAAERMSTRGGTMARRG